MRGVGRGEHGRSRRHALLRPAVVNVGRRQQAEAGVMVLGVVPGEEDVAVGAGILDRAEARRECRPVLQCLELSLRRFPLAGMSRRRPRKWQRPAAPTRQNYVKRLSSVILATP